MNTQAKQIPAIVFFDLEGTLLRKALHLDNGKVAPSAWTALAEALGSECLAEEEQTKDRYNSGGYDGYLDWMADTVRIHKKYGLHRSTFDRVISSAKSVAGAEELVSHLKGLGVYTALVSGGFKALADRVQRQLGIDHSFSACEYFFNADTGHVEHVNLLPADYDGKVAFMRSVLKEHRIDARNAMFIGDGKNDVAMAREVGFSIGFNPQPELEAVTHHNIRQPPGAESLLPIIDIVNDIRSRSQPSGFLPQNRTAHLLEAARSVRESGTYAPYSRFRVGAAVLTTDGRIFAGGNVENASYGATICAERSAILSAVSAGAKGVEAIAVIGDYPEPLAPCGLCRQVIAEFGGDVQVVMANLIGDIAIESIRELLPRSFKFGTAPELEKHR
jgi:phosphoserine phosphatase